MSTPAMAWPALVYLARRLAAFLVDGLLLYAGGLATQAGLYLIGWHPFREHIAAGLWPAGSRLNLWVWASVSVPFWFYSAAWQASAWRATPGKRLFGLRVTTTAGGRLGFGRAPAGRRHADPVRNQSLRHLAAGARGRRRPRAGLLPRPGECIGLLALYLGALLLSPRRRSLPDWAAGSQVR